MAPNPMRWVVLTFVAAIAFAIGLVLYVQHAVDTETAKAKAETAAIVERMEKHGTPLLDALGAVAAPFVAHVSAGRFVDAHKLLAAPYRNAVSVDAFAKTCRASPVLSSARAVTLVGATQRSAGRASAIEARGVLDTPSGGVPVTFTFLEEEAPRVLVVAVAGVPVLQGVVTTP